MDGIFIFIIIYFILLLLLSFERIKKFINQYLSEIFTAISAFGMTLIDIKSDSSEEFIGRISWEDSWPFLLSFFLLQMIVGVIISAYRNKKNLEKRNLEIEVSRLETSIELIKEEYYNLCSKSILNMFMDFYTTGQERISIYKHQGSHFDLLGRCSRVGEYNKRTNYLYNENEGLIGLGWENGEVFLTGIPNWSGNGSNYKNFMKERCNISEERLNRIRMKSRSFYVKTLNDTSTATNPDGIIVFESKVVSQVNKEQCDELISRNIEPLLDLLKNMKSLTNKVDKLIDK